MMKIMTFMFHYREVIKLLPNRNQRLAAAEETLKFIQQGFYPFAQQTVDLRPAIEHSVAHSVCYPPDGFDDILSEAKRRIVLMNFNTEIVVKNSSVLEAAQMLCRHASSVGCLNFASAKNPGGGFLSGSQAQEESLARSSTLYASLSAFPEMYEFNRGRKTALYSDYMIYSPDVAFFRDDANNLLSSPYKLSVITSPAVNVGAILQNSPDELPQAEDVMLKRMDKILALFIYHGIEHLLLGAWGCGVFRNSPEDIARYFAHFLQNDGKYARSFRHITFAVLDSSKTQHNIQAFQRQFGDMT